MKINAYVLEQPGANGINGALFQSFGSVLNAKVSYEPFFVMGDNSVALVMLDEEAFKHMDGVNGEVSFMNAFPEAIKSRLNDMPDTNPEYVSNLSGLKDVSIQLTWIRSEADVQKLSRQWTSTDDDCAQWCRRLSDDLYELVQVVELPNDTFAVAHSFVSLSDYTLEEKEKILTAYDYSSWEDLLLKTGSAKEADQIFAECAFEDEALENLSKVTFATFKEAENEVSEIIR